jgi:hypothetical protein
MASENVRAPEAATSEARKTRNRVRRTTRRQIATKRPLGKRAAYLQRQLRVLERAARRVELCPCCPSRIAYLGAHFDDRGREFYSANYADDNGGIQLGPFYDIRQALTEVQKLRREHC